MRCLEKDEAACGVTSIDFSKAFNSVSHQSCLESLKKHGASSDSLGMIHAFLSGRVMKFKVNNTLSEPRTLKGGSPQGTLLGNFLFIMATEDLEKKEESHHRYHEENEREDEPPVVVEDVANLACDEILINVSDDSFGDGDDEENFVYMRSGRDPYNRLDDSDSSEDSGPALAVTGSNWSERQELVLKYVDDLIAVEKLRLECTYSRKRKRRYSCERARLSPFSTP